MLNQSPSLARRFAADRRGTIAIIFALAFIPVLGLAGAAIDFTRAHTARTKLQYALDAAVLAAGSSNTLTNDERIERARKLFDSNYEQDETPVEPTISIGDDGVIRGSVDYSMDTLILGVLGVDEMNIGTVSEAKVGTMLEGEIAMVLDYSWSMNSSGKYQAMREAAIDLVDVLSQDGENDRVTFGLVPFGREVFATLPLDFIVGQSGTETWDICTGDRKYPYNVEDSTPIVSDDDTKWGEDCDVEEESGRRGRGRGRRSGGGGSNTCEQVYDHCSNYESRGLVVRPLTNDFPAVTGQLQAMQPASIPYGYTHISLGLAFGWHLISPNSPWSDGVAYDDDEVLKAIVLLTDGDQTAQAWGPGDSHEVDNGEENLEEMCEAIKDKDVVLITVAFDLDSWSTRERLEDCATSPSHFFDAGSNAELAQAFRVITGQLVQNLHLSR